MKFIDFALELGKLKSLKRAGWVKFKIPQPESVAAHSFRLAVLALFLAPKAGADVNKSVKMALVHDIGEAKIGDIVTSRGKTILENLPSKIELERKALLSTLSIIDEQQCIELFDEFEENKTKEARLVKQLDKLEMAIQAYEYEKKHTINLQEFFDNSQSSIDNEYLKELLEKVLNLRK